ncbi:uncharacterized protein LOC110373599 [Helicoverpa armigera]|uniref:uncharacterized protein LOC110373599 n=1 Tax=Helicoverpa armigera TaxID=29058 RepID=UPI0030836387
MMDGGNLLEKMAEPRSKSNNIRRKYSDVEKMVSEYKTLKSRETQVELMRLYKGYPILCHNSHEDFTNPTKRKQAYEMLLDEYKKFDKTATVAGMQHKLNCFKSAAKREKAKMQSLLLSVGRCEYEPPQWWYPYLSFLHPFEGEPRAPSPDYFYYRKAREEMEIEMKKHGLLPEDEDQSSSEQDPAKLAALNKYSAEALGKTIRHQIQELDYSQRGIAEKLIEDILFYAKMERLTQETVLQLEL